MLAYITFRFELRFGIAAIIALIHDVLFMLSVYSILRIPVNSPFVAAILTILGYSINDTIVVFDRIRENLRLLKKNNFAEVANISISQTLSRSINTSVTTLVTIVALYVLGVEQIREFALPLMAGVLGGTYSSIFIASPAWVMLKEMQIGKNLNPSTENK
jgi:preprotein translocase SecF subunit